jgi:hypothetical protein
MQRVMSRAQTKSSFNRRTVQLLCCVAQWGRLRKDVGKGRPRQVLKRRAGCGRLLVTSERVEQRLGKHLPSAKLRLFETPAEATGQGCR